MAIAVGSSVTQTPGVSSFGALKKKVAQYVQAPNDAEVLEMAGDGIHDAIDYLNSWAWLWNYTSQDITLAASTDTYDVVSTFKKPRKAQLLDTNSKIYSYLKWKDPKTFWDEHTDKSSEGHPQFYTVTSSITVGKVELDVEPTSAFVALYPTLRLQFIRRINRPTSDGESVLCPSEVQSFLLWYARWYLGSTRGISMREIDRALAQWSRIWQRLRADDCEQMSDF